MIKRRIVRRFHPDRIVLFGSQARGDARPDSDADLLVVMPSVEHRRRTAARIHATLEGIPLGKDVIVATPDDVDRLADLAGKSNRRFARAERSMSPTHRRRALARRRLSKARTDLALATVVLEKGPNLDAWACCFHAQQAAEKALKAVLVARGTEPPPTHDLGALSALLADDLAIDVAGEDLGDLTTYATGARYVFDAGTEAEEPTRDDAERAVVTAGRIYTAVRAHLGEAT